MGIDIVSDDEIVIDSDDEKEIIIKEGKKKWKDLTKEEKASRRRLAQIFCGQTSKLNEERLEKRILREKAAKEDEQKMIDLKKVHQTAKYQRAKTKAKRKK